LRVKELIEASMSANMNHAFADLMNAGHFLKMGMWDFYGYDKPPGDTGRHINQ
jgi:hypothetical protein